MGSGPRWAVTSLAVGGVLLLGISPSSEGFDVLGHSLGLLVRDVRVFNDFEDPTANDNQVEDPMFPGMVGAPLAIWKAAVEWGSALHGDGSGDPTQFDGLGSGGADFDFSWQGLAEGPGLTSDNTHSTLHASDTGVLAFAEFGSGGWRIRYYENWNWDDGPGAIQSTHYDLQSCAAHELGHALGLGHSTLFTTMYAVQSGGDTSKRSLLTDDRLGVQAVYGVAPANKPMVTGAVFDGTQLTLTGTGFSSSGNEVWFTRRGPSAIGQIPKVLDVASNGTTIVVTPPAEAASGDVLVRRAGGGPGLLSNAWPVALDCTSGVVSYCSTTANSAGPGATIGVLGSQSVGANDLVLTGQGVLPQQFGLFFYGSDSASTPVTGGILCVAPPLHRLAVVQADAGGAILAPLDLTSLPSGAPAITPGTTWRFQLWYRDPQGAGSDFSNALAIPFCP